MLRRLILGWVATACLACPAMAPLRVVTLGDSHATVEAGFGQALAEALGLPVEHAARGVVGASVRDLLADIEGGRDRFRLAAIRAWRPNWLLLAFGSNEAKTWSRGQEQAYEASWSRVLADLKASMPDTRIIILGPPDAQIPGLTQVRFIEAASARNQGIEFLDRVALMGGQGSMEVWRTAQGGRYASKDRIHLTAAGYGELARRVAKAIAVGSGAP